MDVDPHTAKHRADYAGRTYYFCSARCRERFVAEPTKYLAPEAAEAEPVPEGTIYTCPMHPADPPGRTGLLSDLRHGPRAADGDRGLGTQSRTRRYDPPVLDRAGAVRSGCCAGDGRSPDQPSHAARAAAFQLAAAHPRNAGGPVGRLAVLRPRLELDRQPQPEHVHADCLGYGRRVALQRRRHGGSRNLPGGFPRDGRVGCRLLRGCRCHHRPRPPGAGAGAQSPRADLGRHSRPARSRAEDRAQDQA